MSELNVDKSEMAPAPGGSNAIEWDDFMRVDLRVGTIISVKSFRKHVGLPINCRSILVMKLA